jgi:hypothetical protein
MLSEDGDWLRLSVQPSQHNKSHCSAETTRKKTICQQYISANNNTTIFLKVDHVVFALRHFGARPCPAASHHDARRYSKYTSDSIVMSFRDASMMQ